MSWVLYEDDCFNVFPELDNDSIDLIILDPPYNIGKDKWDKFPSHEDYLKFIKKTLIECQRVLKDNGSLYLWHNQFPVICDFQYLINNNTDFVFKQLITWSKIDKEFKNSGFVNQRLAIEGMRNYYNGFTEYCLFYTFQDDTGLKLIEKDRTLYKDLRDYCLNLREFIGYSRQKMIEVLGNGRSQHFLEPLGPQWQLCTEETYNDLITYFQINQMDGFREYEDLRLEYEDLRYTFNVTSASENLRSNSNVWLYPPEPKIGHITPKPIKMCENIILHSSNEFDTVLIPFAGSGSEMKASENLNRNVIGIEREAEYCNIIRERMATTETLQVEQRKQQTLLDYAVAK